MTLQSNHSWRLSCIEEEDPEHSPPATAALAPEENPGLSEDDSDGESFPPPPDFLIQPELDTTIYSKPDHTRSLEEEAAKLAIKKITGKYDSLGRMQKGARLIESHAQQRSMDDSLLSCNRSDEHVFTRYVESSQKAKGAYQPPKQSKMLSEQEVLQVEMFFRSHKTEVYVGGCETHMYFGTVRASPHKSPTQALPDDDSWTFFKNGVPVLVLDSGESRRSRKLTVVFAERSTGFILWKDTYNHLTNYRANHPSFHTLHLSNDHTKVVGLSFEDPGAASDFVRKIHAWTSDPNDSILNLSSKKKKKKKEDKKKYKAPNKSDISSPCCFTHITQLDRSDGMTILGSSSAPTSPSRETMRTMHLSPIRIPNMVSRAPPNT